MQIRDTPEAVQMENVTTEQPLVGPRLRHLLPVHQHEHEKGVGKPQGDSCLIIPITINAPGTTSIVAKSKVYNAAAAVMVFTMLRGGRMPTTEQQLANSH